MSILDVLIFDLYRESFIIKISIYSSSKVGLLFNI
jgi:hypothetical protein